MALTYRQIYDWIQTSLSDNYLDLEAVFYEPYTDTHTYIDELVIEPYPIEDEDDFNAVAPLRPVMKGKQW